MIKRGFRYVGRLFRSSVNFALEGTGYALLLNDIARSPLFNVFNTSNSRTVLLSYIRDVFVTEDVSSQQRHTNRYTTWIIADVLRECGYNVDVINYNENIRGDLSRYDFVIGLGNSPELILRQRIAGGGPKVIWFGTGCNPFFSNMATIRRVGDFYNLTGKVLMNSSRYIHEDWPLQHEFADWIILHGATFAMSTYRKDRITAVDGPVFIHHVVERSEDDLQHSKSSYLWFGNGGAIHKGLDLVIESFRKIPELKLHICGDLNLEPEFYNYYKQVFQEENNIFYHGFVNVNSKQFADILKLCCFVVYPSASEGNSPSVITCMANGGLIPIVTENADVDLNNYGLLIQSLTVDAVTESIQHVQSWSISKIKEQQDRIIRETTSRHSFENFRGSFKNVLQDALSNLEKHEL
jgi:glycosyltransferase involved in cell wall biosynthesis